MAGQMSTASYQVYTKGIDYPKSKQEVISYAKKNDAPDGVIRVMNAMEDREYQSAADLAQGFGAAKDKIERGSS